MTDFSRYMKQDVTYWAPTGYDQYGKTTFSAPVTIKGRWEDRQEQIRAKSGSEIMSKARVFVAQAIRIDGYLYLGTSTEASPHGIDGAYEIQQIGRQPDLRSLKNMNVAHL